MTLGVLTASIVIVVVTYFPNQQLRRLALGGQRKGPRAQAWSKWLTIYYLVLPLVLLGLVIPWLQAISGVSPIIWVFKLMFTSSTHMRMLCYWAGTLALAIALVRRKGSSSSAPAASDSSTGGATPSSAPAPIPNIIVRKFFHLLALVLFVPGLMVDAPFLGVSYALACALFVFMETLKFGRIPPLGPWLAAFMDGFTDARDQGVFTLTHIYLLLGCAVPLWMTMMAPSVQVPHLSILPYAGLIVIGLGDSFASLAGLYFGRHKWPGTSKTVEGTVGGVISMLAGVWLLGHITGTPIPASSWGWVGAATVLAGVMEAATTQIDNLVLPLFYYSLFLLTK
eukprot:TRINITY_DN11326_c0_g1_i8.p1 TRINITY_DN11326_c0_g1~~TRINITY_DN11326_c0_g1_i8.p1  ORF type:complete len:339 (-),score=68.59 TRINITY_DN11326_c0_g1_i8:100-1116(-)